MNGNPLVSIIIRTCNRPMLLRQALQSVRAQTYPNLEVIVVEDGKPAARSVIDEFPDLNVHYHSTNIPAGRTRAANIGLELSNGDYINFLDDDDLLLPHHVLTLLKGFEKHPDAFAVHAAAIERYVKWISVEQAQFITKGEQVKYDEPLEPKRIYFQNMFPIQAVLFKRELYERSGGLDEQLELLEDWDLWIRYSEYGKFYFVNEVTSVYHISVDRGEFSRRKKMLKHYERYIAEKYRKQRALAKYRPPGPLKKLLIYIKRYGIIETAYKLYKKATFLVFFR